MNYLDIILAVPLIWAIYKGFTKGLIFSVASLLALVLGMIGAVHFSPVVGEYVQHWFHPDPAYIQIISFSFTFLLIIMAIYLVAFMVDKLLKAIALGFVNRLAGVVFNIVKVAFILSVILSLLNYLNDLKSFIPEEDREKSILYEPISSFAPSVFPYLKFDEFSDRYLEQRQEQV